MHTEEEKPSRRQGRMQYIFSCTSIDRAPACEACESRGWKNLETNVGMAVRHGAWRRCVRRCRLGSLAWQDCAKRCAEESRGMHKVGMTKRGRGRRATTCNIDVAITADGDASRTVEARSLPHAIGKALLPASCDGLDLLLVRRGMR